MYPKLKNCDGCKTERVIWKCEGRLKYCRTCWNRRKLQNPRETLSKAIKPRSVRRIIQDKKYSILRKRFLQQHSECVARLPECTWYDPETLTIHHKKGRTGSLYLDSRYWIPLCLNCHRWVNDHPNAAIELGLSEPRLHKIPEKALALNVPSPGLHKIH